MTIGTVKLTERFEAKQKPTKFIAVSLAKTHRFGFGPPWGPPPGGPLGPGGPPPLASLGPGASLGGASESMKSEKTR